MLTARTRGTRLTTLIVQDPANANVVLDAITSIYVPGTSKCRIAVAYVTREGARLLVRELSELLDDWDLAEKTLITCFDFGHTDPSALTLLTAEGFDIRIANLGAGGKVQILSHSSSFHPKIYMSFADDQWAAVVGSANLSRRALTVNAEAVTILAPQAGEADETWGQLVSRSASLTTELLDQYRLARPKPKKGSPPAEPPVPAIPLPGELAVFRDEVEAGRVDPSDFQAFWVEVGGASGGSGNQLELPRRGQRFFGFDFDDYDDEHHVLGEPAFTNAGRSWPCRVTWHGNNRMERVNLPTTAKSGLSYSKQVVLFQRTGHAFEISVAGPTSERAQSWRDESAASRTIYRFGPNSTRRCGLL